MEGVTQAEYDEQWRLIAKVHEAAQEEEKLLDEFSDERKQTISAIVGDSWLARTFPDKYPSDVDPLLARKFRNKAGYARIRLEKLLLQLDNVQSFGNPEIRDRRREEVKYLQSLLKRADALDEKAVRLVDFQEKLASLGKETLRSSLEAPGPNAKQGEAVPSAERRFATESPRSAPKGKMVVEEDHPSGFGHSDSTEDVQMAQNDLDRKAEYYYRKMTKQQQKEPSRQTKKRTQGQESTDDESDSDDVNNNGQQPRQSEKMSKSPRRTGTEEPSSNGQQQLAEPQYKIDELPRAYVITIQDANVRHARVGIDEEGVLTVAMPGRAPLKYSLGTNINVRGVTKESQGPYLRIVLPKKPERQIRSGWPGRAFGSDPLSVSGWGGRESDFWSRF